MKQVIGIDVGGTRIKALAVDETGVVLAHHVVPTGDDGTDAWKQRVAQAAAEVARMAGITPAAYGFVSPGMPSCDGLSIASMPGRLQGLEGQQWQELLQSPAPVPVLNDAQAALLGEIWLGAGHGSHNAFLLTLGTGVGGAAVVDGRLLRGHLGRAGHLGHVSLDPEGDLGIVGTPGSLEDAIGDHSLGERTQGRFSDTRELVAAAVVGDPVARDAWDASVRALAAAIAGLINVLDPECIILGGGISHAGDALFDPLSRYLDRYEWRPGGHRVDIVPAILGDRAGALGAARIALDSL
jgi:glucokinase